MIKYILAVLVLFLVGYIYDKYKKKQLMNNNKYEDKLIKDYLYTPEDNDLKNCSKPILWIPLDYNINSREWLSFGSRNSNNLNQPYILLCVNSIIKNCSESFKIVIIDDSSYEKIIPGFENFENIPEPTKSHLRKVANIKLLYYYGGMLVPPSFICKKDLLNFYNENVSNGIFMTQKVNRHVNGDTLLTIPNIDFMGGLKNNEILKDLLIMFSNISSKDNTSEIEFLGKFTNYSLNKIKEGLINITEPKETGIVDKQSKIIDLADLFGEMPINYSDSIQGILLPQNELLRRDKYSFINRMTFEDIAKSDMMICKHLLTSN
jgi:hypothetical protein